MNCLSTYGTDAFHIGTLNSSRSAESNRSKVRRAAAHASPSAPCGCPPPNTVILAFAPTAKSGTEPSHRSQCSTSSSGWDSRYASVNTCAIRSDSDASPRGEAEMCSSLAIVTLLHPTGPRSGSARSRKHTDRGPVPSRSEEHTSELQSRVDLVCRLLLEKKTDMMDSMWPNQTVEVVHILI